MRLAADLLLCLLRREYGDSAIFGRLACDFCRLAYDVCSPSLLPPSVCNAVTVEMKSRWTKFKVFVCIFPFAQLVPLILWFIALDIGCVTRFLTRVRCVVGGGGQAK